MEIPEYFVYCGIFITQSWSKRSVQIAKGEFLEVPCCLAEQIDATSYKNPCHCEEQSDVAISR